MKFGCTSLYSDLFGMISVVSLKIIIEIIYYKIFS